MLRRRLSFSLAGAAALTLIGGLTATALLFIAVSQLEYDKMTLSFQQRANVRLAAIGHGLEEAVEVLTVTNQLFASVAPVSRTQFHDFTQPLLARYPFVKAFNFHRIVNLEERAAYESSLQAVVPGAVIREMRAGAIVPAPARPTYSVVDYLEPMRGNEAAFGLDVGQNALIGGALDRMIERGGMAATGLLSLAQDNASRAFEVLMPVYQHGAPLDTPAARRAALIGDTAVIIRAGELVQTILRGADLISDSIVLRVYAGPTLAPGALVFASGPAQADNAPLAAGSWGGAVARALALDYHDQFLQSLSVAGQPWQVQVIATPRPFLADHLGSLSTLVGGILFSLLMTAFVHILVRRSRRVQRLVEERTAELKLSNELLRDDVLVRQRAEKALQHSAERFRQLVAMSSDWYWEQDADYCFTTITGGIGEKAGLPLERFIGKTRWDTVPGMAGSDWGTAHIARVQAHLPFSNLEYPTVDLNGAQRWLCVNGEPWFDECGQFQGYRGTGTDITARKLSEQRIAHIAHHDLLTGLPNRGLLQDRLGQAIALAARTRHPLWVMLIDLDRFKFVNDSMGHKAGDLLLKTVATRLLGSLRETDTVARLSGDEFVVSLTEHADENLGVEIIQRVMDTVAMPLMLEGKEFFVTCSIGVAPYRVDGAANQNLIEQADIAMYRAKKLGRNNYQFYTPAMNDEALERVRIESALRNALERDEFLLHYQAQVDLTTGRVVGMEALIRWQHPELGVVAPNRFVHVAEETGLIVPIGAWVLRTACRQTKQWQDAGLGRLRVAVNLSARQFGAPQLIDDIKAVLADTGLSADSLDIELTESLFMSDLSQAVELMHRMKGLGVSLSIDDFGTGYSSLSYLSRFPIDVLKIDRSFVSDIGIDANDAAIVDSIIALAHNLKLAVIAEGVETEQQLDYLRRHGCDQLQGYLFSRPLPALEFEQLLRQRKTLALPALHEVDVAA